LITSSSGGGACTATLELQGDHADALVHVLRKEGFTDVAKSGASGNSKPQLKWNSPKKVKEEHAKIKVFREVSPTMVLRQYSMLIYQL